MAGRSIENELGFVLTLAHARVFRSVNEALTSLDLHVRTYTVLSIACDGDGVTQRSIATGMGLDPSRVVGLVDDLEQRGLVVRTADPDDRRNRLITPTAAGRAACEKACRASESATAQVFASVDPATTESVRKSLVQMVSGAPRATSNDASIGPAESRPRITAAQDP
ncbi:MAG TPA: MarR family transcriptional regulator [Aldersonia sp.]